MFAATAMIASCSKNDYRPETDPVPTREDLKISLTGKWAVPSGVISPLIPTSTSTEAAGGAQTDEAGPVTVPTYVEFFSDSTFLLVYENHIMRYGSYTTKSADSLNIEFFGSAGGIRIKDNKLEFRFTEEYSKKVANITATKQGVVGTDERTGNISRKWYMQKEEGYREYYSEIIDSVNIRYSNYGTVLAEYYAGTVRQETVLRQWQWVSNGTKLIWTDPASPGSEPVQITVRELGKTVLKTTEMVELNSDNPGPEELKVNFIPVK